MILKSATVKTLNSPKGILSEGFEPKVALLGRNKYLGDGARSLSLGVCYKVIYGILSLFLFLSAHKVSSLLHHIFPVLAI